MNQIENDIYVVFNHWYEIADTKKNLQFIVNFFLSISNRRGKYALR